MTTEVLDAKEQRKEQNYIKKVNKEIDQDAKQPEVESLTITIEWKKSRMWGMNPHATARVLFADGKVGIGTAKASGCGYCKRSTVIADIFNQFLKYKLHEPRFMKKLPRPYGISTPNDGQRIFAPYYMGGIGEGCYLRISEYIGGAWESIAHTNSVDVYRYMENKS